MFHDEETNFLTTVMLLCDSTPISADTARGQNEELSLLDEDDTMHPADEIHGMEIPDGFCLQEATPAALDISLLQRGVLSKAGPRLVRWADHSAVSGAYPSPLFTTTVCILS